MRRLMTGLGVAALFTLAAAVPAGDEEKVTLDKVPGPVLTTVKARFPGAKLTGASKEKEKDKWVYEVSLTEKGKDKNVDVTLTPEGELLTIERALGAKALPKAVAKAIEDKYPRPTYKNAEEVIKVEKQEEKLAYYEVLLVTHDKKRTMEVQVTAAGKIVAEEEKKGNDKD
ncbi:MAG TPA: PepSY-like domain-containing protein [Fimbriiglobus sp.]|nr:PepSY-like domain-containing protein [Fimbriiglobus sp.]